MGEVRAHHVRADASGVAAPHLAARKLDKLATSRSYARSVCGERLRSSLRWAVNSSRRQATHAFYRSTRGGTLEPTMRVGTRVSGRSPRLRAPWALVLAALAVGALLLVPAPSPAPPPNRRREAVRLASGPRGGRHSRPASCRPELSDARTSHPTSSECCAMAVASWTTWRPVGSSRRARSSTRSSESPSTSARWWAPARAGSPSTSPSSRGCGRRSSGSLGGGTWGSAATRDRLYRLLYGGRAAVEEAMLQAPPGTLPAVVRGDDEPSSTPSAEILGVQVHSGDILVSRGGAPTSALIARGNDYPGNFSHVGLVHVDGRLPGRLGGRGAHRARGRGCHPPRVPEGREAARDGAAAARRPAADRREPHAPARGGHGGDARRPRAAHPVRLRHGLRGPPKALLLGGRLGSVRAVRRHALDAPFEHLLAGARLVARGVRCDPLPDPGAFRPGVRPAACRGGRVAATRRTLFADHVDNAVVDAMLEGAERGDTLDAPWYLLPCGTPGQALQLRPEHHRPGGAGARGPLRRRGVAHPAVRPDPRADQGPCCCVWQRSSSALTATSHPTGSSSSWRAGQPRRSGAVVPEAGGLHAGSPRIFALHKPRKVVVSRVREGGARTVFELLPEGYRDWYAVGRLDKDSEGLLLLCDDPRLAQRLMDPGGVAKSYLVTVRGFPRAKDLEKVRRGGVVIDGRATSPVEVTTPRQGPARRHPAAGCPARGPQPRDPPALRGRRIRGPPLDPGRSGPGGARRPARG